MKSSSAPLSRKYRCESIRNASASRGPSFWSSARDQARAEGFQEPRRKAVQRDRQRAGSVRAFVGHMSISARRTGIALLLVVAMTGFAATFRAARREPAASPRTQNAQPDAQPGDRGQATTQKPAGDDAGIVSDSEREDAIARAQVWRQPRTRIARATLTTDTITTATCRFKMEALGGTTPKFRCVLPSGLEIRAKYGRGRRSRRKPRRRACWRPSGSAPTRSR